MPVKHKSAIIVIVFLFILTLLCAINLILLLESVSTREKRIDESIERVIKTMEAHRQKGENGTNGADGYTPIKGIDYFDGKDGENGQDSVSVHTETTIIKETAIHGKDGKDGADGLIPELRCNVAKNRWEFKYVGDLNWLVLNDEPVRCTI